MNKKPKHWSAELCMISSRNLPWLDWGSLVAYISALRALMSCLHEFLVRIRSLSMPFSPSCFRKRCIVQLICC